jgi:hypothetical protein
MTQGTISGGWSFVIAAYSVTAAVFLIYGITLIARLRDEERKSP